MMKFLFSPTRESSTMSPGGVLLWSSVKAVMTVAFAFSAFQMVDFSSENETDADQGVSFPHRRLEEKKDSSLVPSYMKPLMKELEDRKDLFRESPPEEVKYWFEYSGALQVS